MHARSQRLVVRLSNWVGEVVLSLPALRRLESAGHELQLVGRPWARVLLEGHGWNVHAHPGGVARAARLLRSLRPGPDGLARAAIRPAPALLFTQSWSSAIEARLGGLQAAGYRRDGRGLLLARSWPAPRQCHAAHRYWRLVSHFLGEDAPFPWELHLRIAPARGAEARARLAARGLRSGAFVALCPFSGADDSRGLKLWPGFAALAQRLAGRGLATVVCPGPGEELAAQQRFPGAVLLPGLPLGTYAAVLREARVVVANDTGPAHLAAAAGAAVVGVYGPRSTGTWVPIGPRVRVLHTQRGWSAVDQVLEAALR